VLLTRLAERGGWKADQAGHGPIAERAQAEAERLLAEHKVPPLGDDQERELDEIMREAEKTLAREKPLAAGI
jgi:trimethylamine:corrinoid methyltransferase-like protein